MHWPTFLFVFYLFVLCSSCRQQGHVGSKTLLQQSPPVLNWGWLLTLSASIVFTSERASGYSRILHRSPFRSYGQPADQFIGSLSLSSQHSLFEHSNVHNWTPVLWSGCFFPHTWRASRDSVALSHVWWGLPNGGFQSDGDLQTAAAAAQWWPLNQSIYVYVCFICQRYNASHYADTQPAVSQSYDDLTERIEQALRISASGLSTNCNTDQSMVWYCCDLFSWRVKPVIFCHRFHFNSHFPREHGLAGSLSFFFLHLFQNRTFRDG